MAMRTAGWWRTVVLALPLTGILLLGCDPEGKKECAWTLEPEPKRKGQVEKGYIPVCARNRETMKQDCRLQATLKYAKKIYGRTFRYVDMRVDGPGLPRTVTSIEFCEPKDKDD